MAFRYSGSGWRVAGSIRTFGDQVMAARGSTTSLLTDGTLGDTAHSNRISDHNPDSNGIVRALDAHEWKFGIIDAIFEEIRRKRDPRCKYCIHDNRMFSSYVPPSGAPAWEWRAYTGVNGHVTHGHLSVVSSSIAEQTHPWPWPGTTTPLPPSAEEDDMWEFLNISENLVRHASAQGWFKTSTGAPDKSQKTIDYWLVNLPKLQMAVPPAGFEQDWTAFRRAITNGMVLSSTTDPATSAGLTSVQVAEIADSRIAATTLTPP